MKAKRSTRQPVSPIEGERVVLREPTLEDFKEFNALMKVNAKFFRGVVPTFTGRKNFVEYVERNKRDDYFGFLVRRREDGVLIGKVNLFNIIRRGLQSGCVGYLLGKEFTGNGYATEAMQLMLRFAFRKVKLHRVEADIQPQNAASRALARRAGFKCEGLARRYVKIGGRWRDHERWALLVEDWRKSARK